MIPHIRIEEYDYPLPDGRIAKYPLARRDASKLLEFRDGKITEHHFRDIPLLLPENALMVFNDTKVVPARLHFCRPTGAHIEIFCLEPVRRSTARLSVQRTADGGNALWETSNGGNRMCSHCTIPKMRPMWRILI